MKKTLSAFVVLAFAGFNAQSLDPSFGTNGTYTHPDLLSLFEATELSDGNVLLSGDRYIEDLNISQAKMVKMKPDGSIDTSFGTGGSFVIDQYAGMDYYEAFSQAYPLPDGKILTLYGSEYDNGIDQSVISFRMLRLNANGTVDNTFTGYQQSNIAEEDAPYGLIPLPSSKFLVYGGDYIMRFNQNGTLDTTYGNNGVRSFSVDVEEINRIGNALYLHDYLSNRLIKLDNESSTNTTIFNLAQGSYVHFSGNNIFIEDPNNKIIKLNADLLPVSNFGVNGTATYQDFVGSNFVFQPGGSIIAENIDYIYDGNNNTIGYNKNFRRINPNGSLDTSFGTAGLYTLYVPESAPYSPWSDQFLHSNGKLYHVFYDKEVDVANATLYLQRSNLPAELLAVSDQTAGSTLRIVQNPVKDRLLLSEPVSQAKIYDLSGRATEIVFEGSESAVNSLKAGVYMLNATSRTGKTVTLKFIKK